MNQDAVNLQGPLMEIFPKIDSQTVKRAREIQKERLTNPSLRELSFWTRDFFWYGLDKFITDKVKEPFLYVIENGNPAFQNFDRSMRELKHEGKVRSKPILHGKVYPYRMSDLDLYKDCREKSFFEIYTDNPDRLNPEQRSLAERIYGLGKDFLDVMRMLENEGIEKVVIDVVNPEYVAKHARNYGFGRISILGDLDYNFSNFDGSVRDHSDNDVFLRGLLRTLFR